MDRTDEDRAVPLRLTKPARKRRVRLSDIIGPGATAALVAERQEALAESRRQVMQRCPRCGRGT